MSSEPGAGELLVAGSAYTILSAQEKITTLPAGTSLQPHFSTQHCVHHAVSTRESHDFICRHAAAKSFQHRAVLDLFLHCIHASHYSVSTYDTPLKIKTWENHDATYRHEAPTSFQHRAVLNPTLALHSWVTLLSQHIQYTSEDSHMSSVDVAL